jgi:hypothetical protein
MNTFAKDAFLEEPIIQYFAGQSGVNFGPKASTSSGPSLEPPVLKPYHLNLR